MPLLTGPSPLCGPQQEFAVCRRPRVLAVAAGPRGVSPAALTAGGGPTTEATRHRTGHSEVCSGGSSALYI